MGQKVTYTKLTMPFNSLDKFRKWGHGQIFAWCHGKNRQNQPRPQKKIFVDVHKSGSFLGAISKCLKELHIIQLDMRTKILLFSEMISGLMRETFNCLAIINIVMFERQQGRLASQRTPFQLWSTWVAATCGGTLLQGGLVQFTKSWHHKEGKSRGYILKHLKTTATKLNLGRKWIWTMTLSTLQICGEMV